jgi:hypothetical protein
MLMESWMAHPDKTRGGSEKGQRRHAGQISRHSDAGMQARSQHGERGGEASAASTGLPSAERVDRRDEALRKAGESPRGSGDGTPPLEGRTSRTSERGRK